MTSGQVFRWFQTPAGSWAGADGDHWFEVVILPDGFSVTSNAKEEDFRRFFRLDWDADEVLRAIQLQAPEIAPYLRSLNGLRVLRSSDPEETLFSFLCTANNNIRRITGMVLKLASYGAPLREIGDRILFRFPSSEVIAALPEAELRNAGFGYRARTIPDVARQVVERGGRAWLESLKRGTYEEAHRELKSLRGVGPKLADCISLFGLDFPESVPVDTHVWQAACRLYFPEWKDKAVTEQRYEAVGKILREKLEKLAGWGHQHLFYDNVLNWRERRK